MSAPRPPWEFSYLPVPNASSDDDGGPCDVIVATEVAVAPDVLLAALSTLLTHATFEPVAEAAPIHWTRIRSSTPIFRRQIAEALLAARVPIRYVASATRSSMTLGLPLDVRGVAPFRPQSWPTRAASPRQEDPPTEGRWFLREGDGGIALKRAICKTGAGMRLAVIDDGEVDHDKIDLEPEILVGLDEPARGTLHPSLMVAWASRSRTFDGVAPDASTRLYCVPKPGAEVLSLARAIVRAVHDGADVVVCATYVEGSTSPMLDDALEVATKLGRGGRGTPVIMPTGREASSPACSVHSSWSLGFGEPASDPRIFCIGPSGRGDGWFMWRGKKGTFRPFANRGPSVRWLTPGDDIAYPLQEPDRLFHAESSGASAIAAGVVVLVLANNPTLRLHELDAILTRSVDHLSPLNDPSHLPLADPFDVLPESVDRDGHNAKQGYGRLNVTRACLAARDPVALALTSLGEDAAAVAYAELRANDPRARRAYSRSFARWAVRALLSDAFADHALRAVLRHVRLTASHEDRQRAHMRGALMRQLGILLRALARPRPGVPRSKAVAGEVRNLANLAAFFSACSEDGERDESVDPEHALYACAHRVWSTDASVPARKRLISKTASFQAGDPWYG